jgi:hypothetical protein
LRAGWKNTIGFPKRTTTEREKLFTAEFAEKGRRERRESQNQEAEKAKIKKQRKPKPRMSPRKKRPGKY